MTLFPRLFNVYNRFLNPAIPKTSLDRLSNDIMVDGIFDYLDVIDIIRMRTVRYSPFSSRMLWSRKMG